MIRTDLTRLIAISMIIISHGLNSYNENVNSIFNNPFIYPFHFLGQIGVCLFFICSGANLGEKLNLKKKFVKLFPMFIICLVAWEFIEPSDVATFLKYATLTNGFYGNLYTTLWFVPALFGLYILYPLLQKIIKYRLGIIFLISISFLGFIPALNSIIFLSVTIPYVYTSVTLISISPFVLGLITKKIKRKYGVLIFLFPIIYILVLITGITIIQYLLIGYPSPVLQGFLTPFIAYGIFSLTANIITSSWSKTTYMLYLIHPFVASWLVPIYGWYLYPLSIPLLLVASWYLTKANDWLSNFLLKIRVKENIITIKEK